MGRYITSSISKIEVFLITDRDLTLIDKYFIFFLQTMAETKYSYDGKSEGNVLVVGRTGCGKTTFVQNLARNKLFGDIKEVFWISKIGLSNEREGNIRDCF